jgi:nucleoside-diphosphate-sugar epimerase
MSISREERTNMSTIFITGGAGFVGYHTTKEFLRLGHDVVWYDAYLNYVDPRESHYRPYLELRMDDVGDDVRVVRGDVRNQRALVAALDETKPDVVVHLAAIALATASNRFSEEAIQINVNGTVTMLEAVRSAPSVRRVVFASSSFVYGDFQYAPADEAHPTDPVDVYGAAKLGGEAFTKGFGRRFGVEYVVVRLSAVYGPTDANRRVTQIFVERALEGRPLTLDKGGESRVDFTYCADAAAGLAAAALSPAAANQVFNITRGEGRSIRELADVLAALVPGTTTSERPAGEPRPERCALGIEKARRLLGYEPRYSLEDGMAEYVDFVREVGIGSHRVNAVVP